MEQGPSEKTIIEQCVRQRIPLPARIAQAPELLLGLELYYTAFLDLNSCRVLGHGMEGPISWLNIDEYANRTKMSKEQKEDLFYFINKMDIQYLNFRSKKSEVKPKVRKGK